MVLRTARERIMDNPLLANQEPCAEQASLVNEQDRNVMIIVWCVACEQRCELLHSS